MLVVWRRLVCRDGSNRIPIVRLERLERLMTETIAGNLLIATPSIERVGFHNNGLYNTDDNGAYPENNTGLYDMTGQRRDMGRFKAPTLRNIAVTAPYMHDGSIATLEEVIAHYERGGRLIEAGELAGDGRLSPFKSEFIVGFELSAEERADLLAFLESLTDEAVLTDERWSDPF